MGERKGKKESKNMSSRSVAAKRLATVPKNTVWGEMTPLALECKAVNLGQGFPNFNPPPFATEILSKVISDTASPLFHQYCRSFGHLALVAEVEKEYNSRLFPVSIDPTTKRGSLNSLTEILITAGVTQGLNLACTALIDDGDEVISFEPFFDLYANDIHMAGGVVKLLPLHPSTSAAMNGDTNANDWSFSEESLRSLVTKKTKAILINTPMNVPGKVLSRRELEVIAAVAIEHDLLVFSDEVYTSLVYDGLEHICIASLPGMFERTVTMCSAGKTFSCTGWKIGWAVGPAPFLSAMHQVSSHQTFCVTTPLQVTIARCLAAARSGNYYSEHVANYTKKRAMLCDILRGVGLPPVVPAGGFFALADISAIDPVHYCDPSDKTGVAKDWQFCRWLTRVIGVNAIPATAFCGVESRPLFERFARFAYCKTEEDIVEAGKRLQRLKEFTVKKTTSGL